MEEVKGLQQFRELAFFCRISKTFVIKKFGNSPGLVGKTRHVRTHQRMQAETDFDTTPIVAR